MTDETTIPFESLEDNGLIFACELDGEGSASLISWDSLTDLESDERPLWIHLDKNAPAVRKWLIEQSGLTEPTIGAMLADENRPRTFRGAKGVVTILRGINTNPDSEAEDMVALRLWSDGKRVISLRHRKLMTPRDILGQLIEHKNGPSNVSQLYERLITRLTERISSTVMSYDERLDNMEIEFDIQQASRARRSLAELRQDIVLLKRYISPQRDALNSLLMDPPAWLDATSRVFLRETADRLQRFVEELDTARDRSVVIKDDIANQLAESTNRTLYILSIVSAIFLPLGFLTGLLGINVGGMPGVDSPVAFWTVAILMTGTAVLELIIFKKLKWLN